MNLIVSSLIDDRWFEFRKLFKPGILTSMLSVPDRDCVFRDKFEPAVLPTLLELKHLESVIIIYSAPERLIADKLNSGERIDSEYLSSLRSSYHTLFELKEKYGSEIQLVLFDSLIEKKQLLPKIFDIAETCSFQFELDEIYFLSELVKSFTFYLNYFDAFVRLNYDHYSRSSDTISCLNYLSKNSSDRYEKTLSDLYKYLENEHRNLNNSLDRGDVTRTKALELRVVNLAKEESKNKKKIDWLRSEKLHISKNIQLYKDLSYRAHINMIASEVKLARLDYSSSYLCKLKKLYRSKTKSQIDFYEYLLKHSSLFDEKWYLNNYPDVKASGVSAISHFINYGAIEYRNPSRFFNVRKYFYDNPDVKRSKLNPLIHYLLHGCLENRKISGVNLC